jgi:WD40 repeat protein
MSRFTFSSASLFAGVLCAALVPTAFAQTPIKPQDATKAPAKTAQGTTEAAAVRTAPLPAVRVIETQGKRSNAVVVSPNGKFVVVADADGTVRMLDFATGKEERAFRGHTGPVPAVAISGDGRYVATAGSDKTARLFETATGKEVVKREFPGDVTCVWVNMDGTRVLTCSGKEILVWNPTSEPTKNLVTFTGHSAAVTAVASDSKGSVIVSGAKDRTICVWEPGTGKTLHVFPAAHTADIKSIAVDPTGKFAISGGTDMAVAFWDLTAKTEMKRFTDLREPVEAVTIAPDSKRAVAAGAHRIVAIDFGSGAAVAEFAPYRYANTSAAFHPDGRTVIVGGDADATAAADKRGTTRVYELPTAR